MTTPAVVASTSGSSMTVYASWNGAAGVAAWRVFTGTDTSHLRAVATFPSQGFETAMKVKAAPYAEVQALGANGAVLRTSHAVKS